MLIISRKIEQDIVIDGPAVIRVVSIDRNKVRLGVMADENVSVLRSEVHERNIGIKPGRLPVLSADNTRCFCKTHNTSGRSEAELYAGCQLRGGACDGARATRSMDHPADPWPDERWTIRPTINIDPFELSQMCDEILGAQR